MIELMRLNPTITAFVILSLIVMVWSITIKLINAWENVMIAQAQPQCDCHKWSDEDDPEDDPEENLASSGDPSS